MDLKKLIALKKEISQTSKSIKEQKASLEKEKKDLKQKLKELEKKEKQLNAAVEKKEEVIDKKIKKELKRIEIFGYYNVKDLGKVLADIMTFINKEEYEFKIATLDGSRYFAAGESGTPESIEIAIIGRKGKIRDSYWRGIGETVSEVYLSEYETPYVLINSKEMSQCDVNKGRYVSKLKVEEQIVDFNGWKIPMTFNYHKPNIAELDLPDYLVHFMVYASMYRLKHNMKVLSLEELEVIEEKFIKRFASKYIEIIEEEKRKEEEAIARYEQRQRDAEQEKIKHDHFVHETIKRVKKRNRQSWTF